MTTFLEIAKPLLEAGFSVIPIEPHGKRPWNGWGVTRRVRGWIDEIAATSFFKGVPADCNAAICADENIVILETDDYPRLFEIVMKGTGKSIGTWYAGEALTRMACGSSDQRPHLFFKRTEKATNVGNLAVPTLFECRFNNQYVVAPGSTHPSGAIYRWLNDVALGAIPDWLVSELARLALSQRGKSSYEQREIHVRDGRVPEGSRHYFLMRELGRLWTGKLSEEEMIEKAHELNSLCEPPKDDAHILQCVRDIMRKDPFDPGPKVLLGGKAPGESLGEEAPKTGGNPEFRHPSVPGKIQDYVLKPKATPFDGWFPRGRVSLVGGSSGVGKTTLVVDLLNKQRSRSVYLGHEGAGLDFLVLFADRTTLSNVETLTRMGLADKNIPIAYMPVCWDGGAVNMILERIEEGPIPAIVFVEGADALVSDANKTQVVAPFLAGVQKIAEHYHIAVILSVGAPKTKPKEGYKLTRDQIFGSQMWGRMAEDVVILAYGDEDARLLTFAHRNAKSEKFHLEFSDGLLVEKAPLAVLAGVSETRKALKSDKFSELLAYIQSLGAGTILPPLKSLDYFASKETVRRWLTELSNPMNRWVEHIEGGQWVVANRQTTNKGE